MMKSSALEVGKWSVSKSELNQWKTEGINFFCCGAEPKAGHDLLILEVF
jgi:hypothetical protein